MSDEKHTIVQSEIVKLATSTNDVIDRACHDHRQRALEAAQSGENEYTKVQISLEIRDEIIARAKEYYFTVSMHLLGGLTNE